MANHAITRPCRRPGCQGPAAASLSYRYDTRQVWLLDLPEDPISSIHDLCAGHADDLVVPRGWERVDQRAPGAVGPSEAHDPRSSVSSRPPARAAAAAPAGGDVAAAPDEHSPDVTRPPPGNRYAALVRDLPRVAAALAAEGRGGRPPVDRDADRRAFPPTAAESDAGDRPPLPSRELAPLPAQESTALGAIRPGLPEVPGQLALTVSEDPDAMGEAVVVSISSASGRRRAPILR